MDKQKLTQEMMNMCADLGHKNWLMYQLPKEIALLQEKITQIKIELQKAENDPKPADSVPDHSQDIPAS